MLRTEVRAPVVNEAEIKMLTAEFDYDLPGDLIAQEPALERDRSRLLVLHRDLGTFEHKVFTDLADYLEPGDVLVLNNSRVVPARLRGVNALTSGRFEMLLLEENAVNDWWAMLKPGRRARPGTVIMLRDLSGKESGIAASVVETNPEGHRRIRFTGTEDIRLKLEALGEVPLPPYIERSDTERMDRDRERYQTVFAEANGSVAAPTAGLHFTETFLERIRSRGVHVCFLTLHVGLGTFAPVKIQTVDGHNMHTERFELPVATVRAIEDAKRAGRRIFSVGTTTLRVLESVQPLRAIQSGKTDIFIYPPYRFATVDALLTNFHLPRSTLLMLASAFAAPGETRGRELMLAAYVEAIRLRYRFFSYGDAMLII